MNETNIKYQIGEGIVLSTNFTHKLQTPSSKSYSLSDFFKEFFEAVKNVKKLTFIYYLVVKVYTPSQLLLGGFSRKSSIRSAYC
jgi:hypothetical protein